MAFISNGTTILDNGAFSVNLGSQVLIKEQTASSSSTISFVDGSSGVVLDSTYPIYKFVFINIHPSTYSRFVFQADVNGGTSYGQTITSQDFLLIIKNILVQAQVLISSWRRSSTRNKLFKDLRHNRLWCWLCR
jgi:hypothetical protein